jgi:hypothetical protein
MPPMSRVRLAVLAVVALAGLLLATPVHAHRGPAPGPSPAAARIDVAPAPPPAAVQVAPAPLAPAAPPRLAWIAGPAPMALPWPLLAAVAAVVAIAVRRRPRAALALGLVLLVGVLAFESGVHSVHHLGEQGHGNPCAVASTSSNLAGLEVEPPVVLSAPAALGLAVAIAAPSDPRALPESPHEGRAPPRST